MHSWRILGNSVSLNLLVHLSKKKSTTIIQSFSQHWIFMIPSKVRNVLTTPGFPGSTMKLLKPSDSAGTWRGSGIGTNLIWGFCSLPRSTPTRIKLLEKAQWKFFLTSITENPSDYKHIYEICNHLLGRSKDSPLPPGISNNDLAVRFNNYFIQKIANICTDLIEKCQHLPPYIERSAPPGTQDVSDFQPVTLPKLHKIIQSTPNKNCDLDPVPTSLLKQILPSIIPLIAYIINSSLRVGIFPESFKRALVRPLLKKPDLELLERNYRLVSNLGYVSKLMECIVATQLVNHIDRHGLMEAHQSAYHPFHSTTLLKVKSDVIGALEKQEVACLILLDLSVAFDTIDQDILLGRLKSRFAVTGTTLNWLWSYLKHRTQAVEIDAPMSGGSRSAFVLLESGIPQGSVLGPILLTIYTVPIGDICRRHQVEFHLYMDDTQIYFSFRPSKPNSKHRLHHQDRELHCRNWYLDDPKSPTTQLW